MISNHPECYSHISGAIFLTGNFGDFRQNRREKICTVIRINTLQNTADSLQSHAGIHMLCSKWLKMTVRITLILNKNQIPQFNKTPAALNIHGAVMFLGKRTGALA